MTGCLMYVCRGTRPDIAYSVGVLAKYMKQPRTLHLKAAMDILKYIAATKLMGIEYGGQRDTFVGYSDSDRDEDEVDEAVKIMCDNESVEAVLRSPRINEVSKHISRKWNFAKESVALNEVKIEHVSTAKQVADIFTKPLERQKFEAGRLALGVKAWPV
ncbi:hypothetical protein CEUSTIGMA_g4449.t1 [Chlamydomonas eustigma]|uniref:Reverse transcriptase Ty1/copia-type domain-containing protein n=1 Tax=Chlamydomonas eustigma TaxID=1157962 RepID=A0A250X281_9CHLO|nr:hypothetical protein CEUSTIGMA_g4449.t1 [Chlamydomonas eustigma]|eukprot:GAX77002.1 hypothetical protein CEUSTIGMA_g4449.t1 [Chlamydomonas eustigma]